jgi:hypothetical protein
MRSILVTIGQQLHQDQGLKGDDTKPGGVVNGGQAWGRQGMVGANLFQN